MGITRALLERRGIGIDKVAFKGLQKEHWGSLDRDYTGG